MKNVLKLLVIAALVLGITLVAVPAQAASNATTRTVTVTESQINSSYRFTNPVRRTVTSKSADCQPGQVVLTVTTTYRDGKSFTTATTMQPYLQNGRLYWTVTTVLVNGNPPSQDVIDQINASIQSSWVNFIKGKAANGKITAVEVNDSAVVLTIN